MDIVVATFLIAAQLAFTVRQQLRYSRTAKLLGAMHKEPIFTPPYIYVGLYQQEG